ncbi:MAG: lipoate--protein ligase family protein [Smithella sp.]
MDIYNLGMVNWWESQCYYHALAYLGREGVILCRPAEPYICLGLHDDLDQEIDQAFCQNSNLPLLRRETGGGVVSLDHRQVFYQVVLRRENHLLPLKRDMFFAKILQPAIDVFRSFGIEAELAPPADIKAGGRKCSGNAAGDIGPAVAYVGNMIMDFDYELMSRILKVPAPVYRRFLCKAMQDNMLVLAEKIKGLDYDVVESGLRSGFAKVFGTLEVRYPDEELKNMAASIRDRLTSSEWLNMPGRRSGLRRIKINEGLFLQECEPEPQKKGLALIRDGKIEEIFVIEETRSKFESAEMAKALTV